MSLYTHNANQESAERSHNPTLRAIAAEFVPDHQEPYTLSTVEKPYNHLQPLIVASPTFLSTKDRSEHQLRRLRDPPPPLVPPSSGKKGFAARRTRRGIQNARCTVQRPTEWHHKFCGRSSTELVPYRNSISDRPLYGISPLLVQAASPFQSQIERIDEHRKILNRGGTETARPSYDCRSFPV
jgi:hypothetical protein